MTKELREVELDWDRVRDDRVPIQSSGLAFDFGERAFGSCGSTIVRGIVGWDPALGWVLVVDDVPDPRR